jgi:hypothetical protein
MRYLVIFGLGLSLQAAAATIPAPVTFAKDVAPILQKRCQGCHRPGEMAPMPLLTYQQARPWAKAIREAVLLKRMPPWFADPRYGKFSNDRSLTQQESDTLVNWADTGAREGDPKDMPRSIAFLEGWNIGKPEIEIEMPKEFAVPASGTIEYQYIVIPTEFTEDKWVERAEVRPGNRALVHHVIAFVRPPGSKWLKDAPVGEPFVPKKNSGNNNNENADFGGEFIVGYAPGSLPETLEPGQGKLIKAGSDIVFQMHYTANGKPGTDKTKIGLIFAKETPRERVLTVGAMNRKFVIPAGAASHKVDSEFEIASGVKLVGLMPHMHLRGKDFEYRVVYPTGESEVLLRVPAYSFNWQLSYYPAKSMVLPKGTKIECTAHFDNSTNNPNNPDATKEVRWGDQSWEEMMIGFVDLAIDAKADPKQIFPERRKKTASD